MNIKLSLQEIIDKLSEKSGQSKKISESFLRILMDAIEEGLRKDGIAKVKGLGTFKIIPIEQRKSINVQDGTEYIIPAHNKISFTPEKTMKEEINRPYSHLETYILSDDAPVEVTKEEEDEEDIIIPSDSDVITEENNLDSKTEDENYLSSSQAAAIETTQDVIEEIIEQNNKEEETIEIQSETTNNANEEENIIENKEEIMEEKKENIDLTEEINNNIENEIEKSSQTEKEMSTSNELPTENKQEIEKEEEIAPIHEEIEAEKEPKKNGKKIFLILLLLGIIAAIAYFSIKHFDLLNNTKEESNALPPQELVENESPEVANETTEDSEEDLFFAENADETIMDAEEANNVEEEYDTEETATEETSYEVSSTENSTENNEEVAVEKKSFDSELVKFMTDNYPQMNFPSSCPIKNEITMTNGNRLTLVSLKNYDHKNFWVYIYYFNKDVISNPNNVPVGAKIKIPELNSSIVNPNSKECLEAVSAINQKLINK